MSQQSPDTTVASIEDKALDKESIIDLLGQDESQEPETIKLEEPEKKAPKDTKEKDDKETKTGDEPEKELSLEEQLEDELKEPDTEDELDLVSPPSRREIIAKYPTIFKDFPHLERAFYREQKYAEILPTLADAQSAIDKANLLDKYDNEASNGSTVEFLTAIHEGDKEAFAKVVDNYLPTLYKVDQGAYYHTIGNVIKHTIMSMYNASKSTNDDDLGSAAAILNKFIFGTENFTNPQKLSAESVPDNDPSRKKEQEISEREKAFREREFTTARDQLGTRVDNIIKSTVDKAIDPNNVMTDKMKSAAIREVLESFEAAMQRDTRFRAVFDKLWEKGIDSGYSVESMDRIKRAYLSKASTLLPFYIKKARSEYLKGTPRKSNDNGNDDTKDRRGHLPVGKNRSSATLPGGNAKGDTSKQAQIPKGMTSLEYLNSDD